MSASGIAGLLPYPSRAFLPPPCRLCMCSYAFALLLWCLLTGRTNAWADASGRLPNSGTLVTAVQRGERPSLALLRPDVPPAVVALMKRAWAQKPHARPTAAEAAVALGSALVSTTGTMPGYAAPRAETSGAKAPDDAIGLKTNPLMLNSTSGVAPRRPGVGLAGMGGGLGLRGRPDISPLPVTVQPGPQSL